jgi:hypothetical protein
MGDTLYCLGSFEGNGVEELEGVDIHVLRGGGGFTVPDQIEKEIAHLLLPHLFGGPHVVTGEMVGAA